MEKNTQRSFHKCAHSRWCFDAHSNFYVDALNCEVTKLIFFSFKYFAILMAWACVFAHCTYKHKQLYMSEFTTKMQNINTHNSRAYTLMTVNSKNKINTKKCEKSTVCIGFLKVGYSCRCISPFHCITHTRCCFVYSIWISFHTDWPFLYSLHVIKLS